MLKSPLALALATGGLLAACATSTPARRAPQAAAPAPPPAAAAAQAAPGGEDDTPAKSALVLWRGQDAAQAALWQRTWTAVMVRDLSPLKTHAAFEYSDTPPEGLESLFTRVATAKDGTQEVIVGDCDGEDLPTSLALVQELRPGAAVRLSEPGEALDCPTPTEPTVARAHRESQLPGGGRLVVNAYHTYRDDLGQPEDATRLDVVALLFDAHGALVDGFGRLERKHPLWDDEAVGHCTPRLEERGELRTIVRVWCGDSDRGGSGNVYAVVFSAQQQHGTWRLAVSSDINGEEYLEERP